MIDLLRDDFVFILLLLIAIGSVVFVVKSIASLFQPRTKPMTIDVTALNASISTLSTITAELSTQIGDPTADQQVVDGVASSLAPIVSALNNLVSQPSVVSTVSDVAQ